MDPDQTLRDIENANTWDEASHLIEALQIWLDTGGFPPSPETIRECPQAAEAADLIHVFTPHPHDDR